MASLIKSCTGTATLLLASLLPSMAAGVELPADLVGSWTKQTDRATGNPQTVTLAAGTSAIGDARCALDNLRQIHSSRWYADFSCGREVVWLDVSLLGRDRMMINQRPLAEADIYVRRPIRAQAVE